VRRRNVSCDLQCVIGKHSAYGNEHIIPTLVQPFGQFYRGKFASIRQECEDALRE
jgi:hypothetical protein